MEPAGRGTIHNFKNEWKFSFEIKQKASGELYFGSIKIRSDDAHEISGYFYKLMDDIKGMSKEHGYAWVKGLGEGSDSD